MSDPIEYEIEEDPLEAECHNCHGDGRDPYTDYLLPCPVCQGEQTP
jgi:Zn finger protein HypA/HybF involved in hydrogenase expression